MASSRLAYLRTTFLSLAVVFCSTALLKYWVETAVKAQLQSVDAATPAVTAPTSTSSPRPDVSLSVAAPPSIIPGRPLSLTLTATNAGDTDLPSVQIAHYRLTPALVYAPDSASTCLPSDTRTVVCYHTSAKDPFPLPKGQSRSFSLTFTVPPTLPCTSRVALLASIATPRSTDANARDNALLLTLPVSCDATADPPFQTFTPPADTPSPRTQTALPVTQASLPSDPGTVAVRLTLDNAGTQTAHGVYLLHTPQLPAGSLTYIPSGSDDPCTLLEDGKAVLCSSPEPLTPDAPPRTFDLTYVVSSTALCGKTVSLSAAVNALSTSRNPATPAQSFPVPVTCPETSSQASASAQASSVIHEVSSASIAASAPGTASVASTSVAASSVVSVPAQSSIPPTLPNPSAARIGDNAGGSFDKSGVRWTEEAGGYGGSQLHFVAQSLSGSPAKARWDFNVKDLSQTFDVYATWNPSSSLGTVTYSAEESTTRRTSPSSTLAFSLPVTQSAAPEGILHSGAMWKKIGTVTTTGKKYLLVWLSIPKDRKGSADAVLLVPASAATASVGSQASAAASSATAASVGVSSASAASQMTNASVSPLNGKFVFTLPPGGNPFGYKTNALLRIKNVVTDPPEPGGEVTYRVTVWNDGNLKAWTDEHISEAHGVYARIDVSKGLQFVPERSSSSCVLAAKEDIYCFGTAEFKPYTLPVGQSSTYDLTFSVPQSTQCSAGDHVADRVHIESHVNALYTNNDFMSKNFETSTGLTWPRWANIHHTDARSYAYLSCQDQEPVASITVASQCGDGKREGLEQCDRGEHNGETCTPLYDETCYTCSESCTIAAHVGPRCGDKNVDSVMGETKDEGWLTTRWPSECQDYTPDATFQAMKYVVKFKNEVAVTVAVRGNTSQATSPMTFHMDIPSMNGIPFTVRGQVSDETSCSHSNAELVCTSNQKFHQSDTYTFYYSLPEGTCGGQGVFTGRVVMPDGRSTSMKIPYVSVCRTCGDGFIDDSSNEECDDLNTVDGDGCSAQCKVESSPRKVPLITVRNGDPSPDGTRLQLANTAIRQRIGAFTFSSTAPASLREIVFTLEKRGNILFLGYPVLVHIPSWRGTNNFSCIVERYTEEAYLARCSLPKTIAVFPNADLTVELTAGLSVPYTVPIDPASSIRVSLRDFAQVPFASRAYQTRDLFAEGRNDTTGSWTTQVHEPIKLGGDKRSLLWEFHAKAGDPVPAVVYTSTEPVYSTRYVK